MTKTTPQPLSKLIQDPSCMDDYDPNAMSVDQARAFILKYLNPAEQSESLPIREALGRILAENIISPHNVPGHDNAAMDGIAFRHADADRPLILVGRAMAGVPFNGSLTAGECIKIMTGAMIPKGADTVEMQERIEWNQQSALLKAPTRLGQHIRKAGEDIAAGQTILLSGRRLTAADIGLLASLGIAEVRCFRKLRVAFFSTGDELVSLGQPLEVGQIYDSNRYTLYSMLTQMGVIVNDMGNVRDNPAELEDTLLEASRNHDVVITSGGVSVGEADYMKDLLARHGQVLFWKINMKPGRPLAYGKIGSPESHQAHYFGLPGNPVSTMVTFYQFVREALLVLMGAHIHPQPMFEVVCSSPIKKQKGRTEFLRGILYEENGRWRVKTTGAQGSGVLSSMSMANCFIVLDETIGDCEVDTVVPVQLFEGLF